jgi:hypothetical protein
MKNTFARAFSVVVLALVCSFASIVPVLASAKLPTRITITGIYDGGGSGG